jgi:predicted secreted protein
MAYAVQGRNVILRAQKLGDYRVFACAQSVRLTVETEILETSTSTTGPFKTFSPVGLSEWGVALSGVLFLRDQSTTKNFALETITEQVRNNGYNITITFTDDEGYVQVFSGFVYVPLTEIFKESGSVSKYNVEFKGSGSFTIDVTPPSPNTPPRMRYVYTATGGETFFSSASLIARTIEWVDHVDQALTIVNSPSTPASPKDVEYTSASGRFDFFQPLDAGAVVIILYS